MTSDHTFLIAASCAGVNFLITAFLMLTLRRLWKTGQHDEATAAGSLRESLFIPAAFAIAYIATIVANTVRITIALWMQQERIQFGSLDANQLHRFEGIVVYFAFLLLLFVVAERSEKTILRRLLFPLAIYYMTTLVFPLLNGAFHNSAAFLEHAKFVLLAPLLIVSIIVICKRVAGPSSLRTYEQGGIPR
jgi:exosortase K